MGKYDIEKGFEVPQTDRAEINKTLLNLIKINDFTQVTKRDIFNAYTGIGGLHGLEFKDFDNFHGFTEAKKDFEAGQFFTPHEICQQIVRPIMINDHDQVIDPTCGMSNFTNWVPNESNFTGYDIDNNALLVAKALYPNANFKVNSMEYGVFDKKFDVVLGNPPFNLKWVNGLSQKVFLEACGENLKMGGIVAIVVPQSFFGDKYMYGNYWDQIRHNLFCLGQYPIDDKTFKQMGCKSFPTKVMYFGRNDLNVIEGAECQKMDVFGMQTREEVEINVTKYRKYTNLNKYQIQKQNRIDGVDDGEVFKYKVRKLLFEIKTHKKTRKGLEAAENILEKFENQTKPKDMDWKEWEKVKLTEGKVLSHIKRTLKLQDKPQRNLYTIERIKSKVYIKAHSTGAKTRLTKIAKVNALVTEVNLFDVFQGIANVEDLSGTIPYLESEKYNVDVTNYKPLVKLVNKKKRKHIQNTQPIEDALPNEAMQKFVDEFRFNKLADGGIVEDCKLNPIQNWDVARACTRDIVGLNWEQGGGKTASAYAWAMWKMKTTNTKNVFILSSAISINITWTDFCRINNVDFINLKNYGDIDKIKDSQVVLLSTSLVDKFSQLLRKFTKHNGQKFALLFDESDAITNSGSKLTKATKRAFQKVKRKIIATGTLTRNNLAEIYPQLELCFNNSDLMLSMANKVLKLNKDNELKEVLNSNYGRPFAYRGGFTNFKASFCPSNTSVFGVEKQNQNVYNPDEIVNIISSFCFVRTFEDIVGEDKCNHQTHILNPDAHEMELQEEIKNKFFEMRRNYFQLTGDSRKDAQMRIIQQMRLMIRSCATPHLFNEWTGENTCTKVAKVFQLLNGKKMKNEIVAIGCTGLDEMNYYINQIKTRTNRQVFVIYGDVKFENRKDILAEFEKSGNGILVATQTSLENSVNVPTCDNVILTSMQWNFPRMSQFYFRFIRFDSKNKTNVHYIIYNRTIETNLMSLLITKELMNVFIKSRKETTIEEICEKYDVPEWLFDSTITKEYDEDGKMSFGWGDSNII